MSAIYGVGFGSTHTWVKSQGPTTKIKNDRYSEYRCTVCDQHFRHYYHPEPDIFKAASQQNVSEFCKGGS